MENLSPESLAAAGLNADSTFRDNTMLSTYKECPRKFQIRHLLHWRPAGTAAPLVFGSSWHAAMDTVWQHGQAYNQRDLREFAALTFKEKWVGEGFPEELDLPDLERLGARTPMVAEEMLKEYIEQRWRMIQGCEIIAVEQPFAVPLPGIQDVWYVGRLDKVLAYNGQKLIIEHKTTTEYKIDGGFKTTYIESWDMDSQVKGYEFGGGLYYDIEQVWVDAALVHKKVHDKFRFVPVQHTNTMLMEWVGNTVEWVRRLQHDISTGFFPKNEGACVGKYGPCANADICRTCDDPTKLGGVPERYVVEPWSPFDTLHLNKLIQGGGDAD